MRHFVTRRTLLVVAVALLMGSAVFGQSLGEIARENREKQNAEDASAAAAKPKVITNKDLPKDPDGDVAPGAAAVAHAAPSAPTNTAESRAAERHYVQQRAGEQRAAEQWKKQIVAQKTRMANLQARIDQVQASIRAANGEVQAEQPFNHYQARQVQQVALMQQQLNEQRIKLDQMQDAARRAGMHTAVYDP
jgi:hypothetical protein